MQSKLSSLQPNNFKKIILLSLVLTAINGEVYDLPYSRVIILLLLLVLLDSIRRDYVNNLKSEFRQAAELNDVTKLKKIAAILGKESIRAKCPKTGRNPLHCAVGGKAIDSIVFLFEIEHKFLQEENLKYRDGTLFNLFRKRNSYLVNQRDCQGDTPVHLTLKQMIVEKSSNFDVVLLLLTKKTAVEFFKNLSSINVWPSPLLNTHVDIKLKDDNGKTIFDLLNQISRYSEMDTQYLILFEKIVTLIGVDRSILQGCQNSFYRSPLLGW